MITSDKYITDLLKTKIKRGLNNNSLAKKAGLKASTLQDIGTDKWNPCLSTLKKLDEALK